MLLTVRVLNLYVVGISVHVRISGVSGRIDLFKVICIIAYGLWIMSYSRENYCLYEYTRTTYSITCMNNMRFSG